MKYPHAVIYNGVYYPANTDIPEQKCDQPEKEDKPKVQKSKKKGGAE